MGEDPHSPIERKARYQGTDTSPALLDSRFFGQSSKPNVEKKEEGDQENKKED